MTRVDRDPGAFTLRCQNEPHLKLILGQGLRITLLGVTAGLGIALAVTRLIAAMLYGVRPTDPVTFGGVSIFLTGVALLASYLPAHRATRVDPMVALRHE